MRYFNSQNENMQNILSFSLFFTQIIVHYIPLSTCIAVTQYGLVK